MQDAVASYLARMADITPRSVDVIVDEVEAPTQGRVMATRLSGLTRGTVGSAPGVCRDCVWWQSRGHKTASKERWMARAEEEWGEWGSVYFDDDGRVLGSMQYGPSHLFPRAHDLPAGPPSGDAVLVTCSYLADGGRNGSSSR